MGWYRRSKFAFDTFRTFTSKIIPNKNPIQKIHPQHCSAPAPDKAYAFGLSAPILFRDSASQLGLTQNHLGLSAQIFRNSLRQNHLGPSAQIFRNSGSQLGLRQNQWSPCWGGAKRHYFVDRHQVRHFKPRGYKKWFQNPRYVLTVVLLTSGVVITVYFGNLETVPYTNRTHFVLLSRHIERRLGENQFEDLKKAFKGKILPPIHPESVRIRLIAKDLIESLQRGLKKEHIWSDPGYVSDPPIELHDTDDGHETLMALKETSPTLEGKWNKDDEILDDKWAQQSRKEGKRKGKQPATDHLEGLNWEVLVVHEPVVNAFCLPGGKIVVFTGLLDHFRTDSEIATILGHEVAHAVARHAAEGITKNVWFAILHLILYQFVLPDIVNTMSNLFLKLPFSRKMEMEADYIGLLLMASSGYDPRVAPTVYEKLGQITGESALRDYLSTHPSGKKRAKLLSEAKVMEEAFLIYRETQAGRGIEGFL